MDKKTINSLIKWIKTYVESSNAKGVVLGMSGGKDSLIVAKLCCEAIGADKVYGVIMPNKKMADLKTAKESCELLNINYSVIDISGAYNDMLKGVSGAIGKKRLSSITRINTAPRIRMTILYAIGGSLNYLVANTSNLSEVMVGYTTKWGDNVGDFSPLKNFTKTEVTEIGLGLGLPVNLVMKNPTDGLSGKSDEEALEFPYSSLDAFIRTGKKDIYFAQISSKYRATSHKRNTIASFEYNKPNHFEDEK